MDSCTPILPAHEKPRDRPGGWAFTGSTNSRGKLPMCSLTTKSETAVVHQVHTELTSWAFIFTRAESDANSRQTRCSCHWLRPSCTPPTAWGPFAAPRTTAESREAFALRSNTPRRYRHPGDRESFRLVDRHAPFDDETKPAGKMWLLRQIALAPCWSHDFPGHCSLFPQFVPNVT